MLTPSFVVFLALWRSFVSGERKLPFPPLKGELGAGFMLNLPDSVFQVLRQDAKSLLAHKALTSTHVHDKKSTFFRDIRKKPRFSIEQFAFDVIRHLDLTPEENSRVAGAEYWVQDRAWDESIGFHYDKDEAYASNHQRVAFPMKATVTYLTDFGAPTLILNQTTNQFGNIDVPEIPNQGLLSFPRTQQHIWFQGKAQHGVHGDLAPASGFSSILAAMS